MPPTPATIPSTTREASQGEAWTCTRNRDNEPENQSSPTSKYPFRKSPTVKVRKNTTAIMPKNQKIPQTGWVSQLSIRSVEAARSSLLNKHSSTTSSIYSYFSLIIFFS